MSCVALGNSESSYKGVSTYIIMTPFSKTLGHIFSLPALHRQVEKAIKFAK